MSFNLNINSTYSVASDGYRVERTPNEYRVTHNGVLLGTRLTRLDADALIRWHQRTATRRERNGFGRRGMQN